jgi:hypothetical protein
MTGKLFVAFALLTVGITLHVRHEFWTTANRKTAEIGIPYADLTWDYCDYRCLFLESLKPNVDFYIINFRNSFYKPNFSACYAKPVGGTPQLWNEVITNNFYDLYCGKDTEDYLYNSQYEKISEEGVGVGTLISY